MATRMIKGLERKSRGQRRTQFKRTSCSSFLSLSLFLILRLVPKRKCIGDLEKKSKEVERKRRKLPAGDLTKVENKQRSGWMKKVNKHSDCKNKQQQGEEQQNILRKREGKEPKLVKRKEGKMSKNCKMF